MKNAQILKKRKRKKENEGNRKQKIDGTVGVQAPKQGKDDQKETLILIVSLFLNDYLRTRGKRNQKKKTKTNQKGSNK